MNESFESVIEHLKDTLDKYAPFKEITIIHKSIIWNPYLYSKCINKSKTDITYKRCIKKIAKGTNI
jgi:hypothetical protein